MAENTYNRVVELIMVTADNNNKFYRMMDDGTGTFKVEYGRVEKTCINESYSIDKWDSKLREKLKKGYQDVTHLRATSKPVETTNTGSRDSDFEINHPMIKTLIDELQAYANKTIKQNYSVTTRSVTQAMIDEAQSLINQLAPLVAKGNGKQSINDLLISLYRVIPRHMKNVKEYILDTDLTSDTAYARAQKLLAEEQSLLDTMAGQVIILSQQEAANDTPEQAVMRRTMLDVFGFDIQPLISDDEKKIRKLLGDSEHQYKKAFRVDNLKTRTKYQQWMDTAKNKKEELFWHGSRNENWLNILTTGLLIRPSGAVYTGSMYSDGIYFANRAKKSIGYTSLRGSYWASGSANKAYLSLYDVHVGNQKNIHKHDSSCYSITENKLKNEGYDSVFAHKGADLVNDEFIVYNANQCTVKYLVEIG